MTILLPWIEHDVDAWWGRCPYCHREDGPHATEDDVLESFDQHVNWGGCPERAHLTP